LAGKILVVDDHVDLAENIAEVLLGGGFDAVIATSAEAALGRLEEGDVVALVTDYRLPGLNGAELIRELRRRGSDIPALVMSAFTDDDTVDASRSAGAMEVLAKPVALDRLLSLLAALETGVGLVLVVEDNRDLAENLAEAIRSRGYGAAVTTSVAEAFAARPAPQAAIVDFRLPDGTGIEVAEGLVLRDPRLPILFISGHGEALRASLIGRLAAAEHMDKPVDLARLLAWVAATVGHAKAKRPHR
jgi:DNA-binding NtrC family response regulator